EGFRGGYGAAIILLSVLMLSGFGCTRVQSTTVFMQKVSFQTSDDVTIVGNYVQGDVGKPVVLLLHMMPATKESWASMQTTLNDKGWGSLAIDLRGHGESTYRGTERIYYTDFEDEDHQASGKDIEAAMQFLKEKGVEESNVYMIGASIGANLALRYAATHHAIPAVVLLSPGLEYRGVATLEAIRALAQTQSLFLVASDDDAYSFSTIRELYNAAAQLIVRERMEGNGFGHGTTMLEKNPQWVADIVEWLVRAYSPFSRGSERGLQ
ncbi:MAG: alpha/beta fold hydrolase, partial [bacterium]|nr:alpha/beta fold hydrolase [bacterium]